MCKQKNDRHILYATSPQTNIVFFTPSTEFVSKFALSSSPSATRKVGSSSQYPSGGTVPYKHLAIARRTCHPENISEPTVRYCTAYSNVCSCTTSIDIFGYRYAISNIVIDILASRYFSIIFCKTVYRISRYWDFCSIHRDFSLSPFLCFCCFLDTNSFSIPIYRRPEIGIKYRYYIDIISIHRIHEILI